MRRHLAWLTLVALLLAGCSGGDDDSAATSLDEGGWAATEAEGTAGAPAAEEAAEDGADTVDAEGGERAATGGGDPLAVSLTVGRKVIRTAAMTLEVEDPDAAVAAITRAVERAGGFVAAADLQRSGEGDPLRGTMTLRVPTRALESTLTTLEDLASQVRSKTIGSDDVTGEYSDVEAQLRNLRALETELRALLADIREQTGAADQVLQIFERIRQVRDEIERLEGRRQLLDDLVDLATVDLTLVPSPSTVPISTVDEPWDPGRVLREAANTTVEALQAIAGVAIWVGVTIVPLLALVLLPVAAIVFLARRWRRRRNTAPVT